jgi:polyphosphate kinase
MLVDQSKILDTVVHGTLLPELERRGRPIRLWNDLSEEHRARLRDYFESSVYPILTPLAVDTEHPFPFISTGGLNLAILLREDNERRFVRLKVPGNRPRWVALPDGSLCPLEEIIAANIGVLFPSAEELSVHAFRITRGASGEVQRASDLDDLESFRQPGEIVRQVADELKARRFAGVVRLEVDATIPKPVRQWLASQLAIEPADVYPSTGFLKSADLSKLADVDADGERFAPHAPETHPRLRHLTGADSSAIFDEIARGDILLHHPYHAFDDSVLRFLEASAVDPAVLAIKMTIYRTSADSPIVRALAEASRRGKQVAVLVEINARFDEAPNIAWGEYLEKEGVHVSYGVESLKTHVKLALVVRDEGETLRRYVHVGTGNYHTGTARIYEDLGLLTCEPEICADVTAMFNELTGSRQKYKYRKLMVAPTRLRAQFQEMIRREAEHARAGRRAGIRAKMNQLQDPELIRELYEAGIAGVPIQLIVRGLCCLRPQVPGLSENIRVVSVVGRFLEHSRIYHFVNGGDDEYFIGSSDWMRRNLDRRVETVIPILDPEIRRELGAILDVYDVDNASAWDGRPDGTYLRRVPEDGKPVRAVQELFIRRAAAAAPRNKSPYLIRG